MESRVRRLYDELDEPVDAVVLANAVKPHLDATFFWVTDLVHGGVYERSAAICWPGGDVEVVTTPLEEESARHGDVDAVHVCDGADERQEVLAERLAGLDRIGINGSEVVHASVGLVQEAAPEAGLVDVGEAVRDARLVKDDAELERLQEAADIASEVARELPQLLEEDVPEHEVAAEINYRMQKRGATGPSFDPIVAFGPGSAEPHYGTQSRPLAGDEFALCDFGCVVDRYVSDITRTFNVGKADDERRRIYETVLEAQEAALDAIEPGVLGGDVHEAAEEVIEDSEFAGSFPHGTGHSIGLAVHDGGALHPRMEITLEEDMVFTVEPGIYLPGKGGVRIEDDVVVTSDGCDLLTDAPRGWDQAVVVL